jgi:hypothetical protein
LSEQERLRLFIDDDHLDANRSSEAEFESSGTSDGRGGEQWESTDYRLVNQPIREPLALDFSQRLVLTNCLFVKITFIALTSIVNAISPIRSAHFQLFLRSLHPNCLLLFDSLIDISDTGIFRSFFPCGFLPRDQKT